MQAFFGYLIGELPPYIKVFMSCDEILTIQIPEIQILAIFLLVWGKKAAYPLYMSVIFAYDLTQKGKKKQPPLVPPAFGTQADGSDKTRSGHAWPLLV